MVVALHWLVIVGRIALLGGIAYVAYNVSPLWAGAALFASSPCWEVLIHHCRPLGPNWRWVIKPSRFNHSKHTVRFQFRRGEANANVRTLFEALRHFEDFNGQTNRVARRRIVMKGTTPYVQFDTLGWFGLASILVNPVLIPVRVCCRRERHEVIADTAGGHMLVGQRRWSVGCLQNDEIEMITEAYENPRGIANTLGMFLLAADYQMEVWTNYFDNMRLRFATDATSTKVDPAPVTRDPLPDASWTPATPYPGAEV